MSAGDVCVFSCLLIDPLGPAWRGLWHPGLAAPAWKQTAAAAPVTGPDRCRARWCRVARRMGCPRVADRYHNHTSPLWSLTYWIKHRPSCPGIATHSTSAPEFWRENEASWEERSKTRKGRSDGQQRSSQKLFLSRAPGQRGTGGLCPRMPQHSSMRKLNFKTT